MGEIWDLIESVSEGFPTYFLITAGHMVQCNRAKAYVSHFSFHKRITIALAPSFIDQIRPECHATDCMLSAKMSHSWQFLHTL